MKISSIFIRVFQEFYRMQYDGEIEDCPKRDVIEGERFIALHTEWTDKVVRLFCDETCGALISDRELASFAKAYNFCKRINLDILE